MIDTATRIGALARYVQALRPTWDMTGITRALARADHEHPWQQVEQAALRAAHDERALTPAALSWPAHYRAEPKPAGGSPAVLAAVLCERCRRAVVGKERHSCRRAGDAARGLAAVRAALAERTG